ncbi:SpoIIE family protein phosphatase [Pseudodesulfovibrio sp. zrk46]|uniref:SpoIIE family protein phosphatase n=1 Tax=Pseudodesulfovibrio sp. zrk46 TaxID=2725288 RepID=UPI0014490368|nr:SpoIIE family protein phosphatase [Pseudodesulfovibrio sp. zrk46]QJB55663.1 SpoIIE family protein phosphatase [Pseudodesulfovibrio sp. zrk46]
MKISIRIKFFIVLLAFSLGPILISRGIVGGAAEKVANRISSDTRTELLDIVSTELELNALSLLSLLEAKGESFALGTLMLAQQAEISLNKNTPASKGKPFFTGDYMGMGDKPSDMAPSEDYPLNTRSGRTRPMNISLEHSAFLVPAQQSTSLFLDEARQLMTLLPTLKDLRNTQQSSANWYNVALESGLLMTYPGHGRFPMNYDPREQDWYTRAMREPNNQVVWVSPRIDPSTRRAVTTASLAIRDKDGAPLGVVSIDIPISAIIGAGDLKARWSKSIQSFMLVRYPGDIVAHDGLLIVAQESYGEGGRRHWMSGIEPEWMESNDPIKFKKLLVKMKEEKSGHMRLPYKGEESLWAYASNDDFSFLLITPESVVAKLPNEMADAVKGLTARLRNISSIISGVMLIIVGLIAWFGSRATTKPVMAMAEQAKRLADGDFSVRINYTTGDERDELVNAFNDMVPKLRERMSMRRDLQLAQQVQELLLPSKHPTLSGYDLAGGISFCDQTGGDYYDFIKADNDSTPALGVVLGDVSGHGVASALLMATARGQLHSLAGSPLSPKQRIRAINNVISRDMDGTGRFLTLFYIRLLEDCSTLQWVRAGHDPAFRYNPATDTFSELNGEGLPIGVLEGFEYEDYETQLESGEVLLLATDGVWEARNADGEMFGKQRILAIIRENAHMYAEEIRLALMKAVEAFQANGQEDDIAVVVIKKD